MAETEDIGQLRRRARRRLVGAAAVVLFLVVVPPLLMDLEPKPVSSNLRVEIPSPDATRLERPPASRGKAESQGPAPEGRPDVRSDASPDSGSAAAGTSTATAETPQHSDSLAAAPSRQSPSSTTVAPGDTGDSAATETAHESYFVPLGTFADRGNAHELVRKAGQLGVKAYTEQIKGGRTRVRAGPFMTREAAEKARTLLKESGIDAHAVQRSERHG